MKRLISVLVAVFFMTGMVVAQNNNATTNQEGNNNQAEQIQTGEDNDALIHQGDYKDEGGSMNIQNDGIAKQEQIGDDNEAVIKQRSGSWTGGNESDQFQDGDMNTAKVTFYNANNISDQDQIGDDNWSYGQASGQFNDMTTNQEGDGNWAEFRLLGSESSEATINQIGDDNEGEVSSTGAFNEATIHQEGMDHDAYQMQDGEGNRAHSETGKYWTTEATETEQYQTGDNNVSRFEMQKGYGNYAKSDQDGDNNKVFYRVRGDENHAEFTQNSNSPGNVASARTFGDDNVIDVVQTGTGNMVGNAWGYGIYQDGDRNETYINQDGYGNWAKVKQTGDDNALDYDVVGHDNEFDAVQEDEGANKFSVHGNKAVIDQTWRDVDDNYGNDFDLTQKTNGGKGNRAYMRVKGDDNNFTVTQQGSWNQIKAGTMFPDIAFEDVSKEDLFKFEGDGADIVFTQHGNQNLISGEVRNSYGDVTVDQDGNVNEAFLDFGGSLKFHNNATIIQDGNYNDASIEIGTNGNTANINQIGVDNQATTKQY